MPMKRSGRSVEAASRVIEIDEVVGSDDRFGLQNRAEVVKDLALDFFLLDGGLDHQVAVRQAIEGLRQTDPAESLLSRVFGDDFLRDLARQIAVDGRHPRFQPVGGHIVEHHVEAGERRHMRDAVAHLARADHADLVDCHRHPVIHRNGAHIAPVQTPLKTNTGRSLTIRPMFSRFIFRACRGPRSAPEPPGRDPQPGRNRRPGRSARPHPC